MADNLSLVKRTLDEHETIRGHMKNVGGAVSDKEALAELEKTHADWTPGRFEAIQDKRDKLQQTIQNLEEGLKRHFGFEEKALPPLLGDMLMHALLLQHGEIEREIGEARSMVADAKLEGLDREQLLAQEARIQQKIGVILQLVEEHADKEELILEMVRTALKDKA